MDATCEKPSVFAGKRHLLANTCLLWRGVQVNSRFFPCFSRIRVAFTVELYLQTERLLVVGAETQETQHDWFQALTKVMRFACDTHTHTKVCLLLQLSERAHPSTAFIFLSSLHAASRGVR